MPTPRDRRGARPSAAPLGALLAAAAAVLLAGCSGGSGGTSRGAPAGSGGTPTPSAPSASAPAAALPPGARRVLSTAERTTASLHSYAFVARTVVSSRSASRTTVAGRVVVGRGLAYTLTTAGHRTQVVRARGATFVRAVPGHWRRLAHPHVVAAPTPTLLAVLRGMTVSHLAAAAHGATMLTGRLAPATARAAGLPGDHPATVAVVVDAAGHVRSLTIHTSAAVSGRLARVAVRTTFLRFNAVPAIRRPA